MIQNKSKLLGVREMAVKSCNKPLKSNPFITYRDPLTGKWIVVHQNLPQEKTEGKRQ
ncbi:MAG: hypothetical protein ACRC62_03380 [Microcoleus sp.]